MPPYVGKKALKQQKLNAEMQCLHHPVWTGVFFRSGVDFLQHWLFEEQPLLQRFSLAQLREMDDMILPAEKEDLHSEYDKIMFQQLVNYLELTDPDFENISDDPAVASFATLATVMSTRKKNQMMLAKHLENHDQPLPEPDLMYPLCLYGQLIKFMTEQHLYLCDSFIADRDMRLLVRPLRWYIHLFQHRSDFVQTLADHFSPLLENRQRFTETQAAAWKADIIELERWVSCKAWDLLYEEFPTFNMVKHFLNYYDMIKNAVIAYVYTDSEFGVQMRHRFMKALFVDRDFRRLVSNDFLYMNADKWENTTALVNRHVERIRLEANSDYYFCPKCKNNQCYIESKQTRSADEPATIYSVCLKCSHSFVPKN